MNRIAILLLLCVTTAPAAFYTINPPPLGPNARIVTTADQFTNAAAIASAGDWIIVPPGPRIHVLTNQLNLLRPGVNFEFYPEVVWGCSGDGVARPVFYETTASTNYIIFHSRQVVSNSASGFFKLTNSATRVYLWFSSMEILHTNTSAGIIEQAGGTISFYGHKWVNLGYDGMWTRGAAVNYYGEIHEVEIQDTLVENEVAVTGRGYLRVGRAQRSTAVRAPTSFFFMQGKSTLIIDYLNSGLEAGVLGDILSGGSSGAYAHIGLWEVDAAAGGSPLLLGAGARFRGKIIGPTGFPPVDVYDSDGSVFEDVELVSSTATVFASTPATEEAIATAGALRLNKPVGDLVAVNGEVIGVSGPHTNAFDAAKVFLSLNGHSLQTLVATNSFTLIPTNSTALLSGKTVRFDIINNQTTGITVTVVANCKLHGNGLASATTFVVTNSRHANLEIRLEGTNRVVSVSN